ncbi:uncharacterized protein J4E87_010336 [Alternaria ethzedia]|uniref:uncharacterized protein n=1 Tax=Alternaria ethzedia TaxID=181014 RepID=UPI0020C237EF|nr:uncharacterized protein J4E87_010336 [Alternaria ethzedia]KAI4612146.1 hypothetical protein J4E87_010336 [Alternaria ethzedia]
MALSLLPNAKAATSSTKASKEKSTRGARSGHGAPRSRKGQTKNRPLPKKAAPSVLPKEKKTAGFRTNGQLRITPTSLKSRVTLDNLAEGTQAAPICMDDDGDDDIGIAQHQKSSVSVNKSAKSQQSLVRAFTPLSMNDQDRETDVPFPSTPTPAGVQLNEDVPSGSSRSSSPVEITSEDDEQASDTEPSSPIDGYKSPRRRCLVKSGRYRAFRTGLYTFAITNPKAQEIPFDKVLKIINGQLPVEKQFSLLEAKQVLKYMREKLFDSLCADRVVGVNLEGIKLYA